MDVESGYVRICNSYEITYIEKAGIFDSQYERVKVRVQFTLKQVTKGKKGNRCRAVLFLQPRRQMKVSGQRHAPAALPPGKTRYPLYRRLGGSRRRSGRVRKTSSPTGFDPRTVHPLASHYTNCAVVAITTKGPCGIYKEKKRTSTYYKLRRHTGEVEVQLHSFYKLGDRWGGLSTPHTYHFTLHILKWAEWIPGQVWRGEEYLDSQQDSIPGLSSPQRAAIPSTLAQPCLGKSDRKSNFKFRGFQSPPPIRGVLRITAQECFVMVLKSKFYYIQPLTVHHIQEESNHGLKCLFKYVHYFRS